MHYRGSRVVLLLLLAAALAGCDKCADNYLVDPFAKPKAPAGCHGEPVIK